LSFPPQYPDAPLLGSWLFCQRQQIGHTGP
jgi:hypothetical protein